MTNKYVSDTKAGKSVSAYVILNRKGEHVATIRAHFSDGGNCLVNVFDDKAGFQAATAGGYGYDKFTAAISGLSVDGHKLSDHCGTDGAPKPPKGRKTFPRDYKAPKGYSLANWCSLSRKTGCTLYRDHWINLACDALGIPRDRPNLTDSQWESIQEKVYEIEKAWRESDDCEQGFSDCYRLSGLDYLRAIGYRVIQAI